jgi:peroxiredoxin
MEVPAMRLLLTTMLSALLVASFAWSDDYPKQAPKIVLKSPDGKKSVDLAKLFSEGPVLVRLTCACSGCDAELKYFQKLQAAYNGKGLHTVAVFREPAESLEQYVDQKGIKFTWLADPKGEMWKTFDSKAMPTNILIDKGGRVVRVLPGCTRDGSNAQTLSQDIAAMLKTPVAQISEGKKK